jgi:hypothetical protein
MSLWVRVSPLGCFASLAMTRLSQFILILSLSKNEDGPFIRRVPREPGIRWAASRLSERVWVPAFAGNTEGAWPLGR